MLKNVIVIWDDCQSFVDGFSYYIEKNDKAIIYVVKSLEDLEKINYDYLLISEEFYNLLDYPDSRVFKLSMHTNPDKRNVISRISSVNSILSNLSKSKINSKKDINVLFFSISGGCGKTTLIDALSKSAQKMGFKSLVFAFSPSHLWDKCDIDLSLIIYYLDKYGSVPKNLNSEIEEVLNSQKMIINANLDSKEDIVFLTHEIMSKLIDWISSLDTNRMIFIDSDWNYGNNLKQLLGFCNINILITDDRNSDEQIDEWCEKYNKFILDRDKFYIIKNKSSQDKLNLRDDMLYIPKYSDEDCGRQIKKWSAKYLLTHWIKQ